MGEEANCHFVFLGFRPRRGRGRRDSAPTRIRFEQNRVCRTESVRSTSRDSRHSIRVRLEVIRFGFYKFECAWNEL